MIRSYRPADRDALYRVCLLTADAGNDGTDRYRDPRLVGEVFLGAYLMLQPQFAFVVDGGDGAEGYVLGARDTIEFDRQCEERWWPPLRERYRGVQAPQGKDDGWLLNWIRTPPPAPDVVDEYPSHLHIDLLPRWQRGGWGRRLLDRLFDELATAGSPGVHLGVGSRNVNAQGFYRHLGFSELATRQGAILMGLRLPRDPAKG